jgi:hypothetical protein
MACSQKHLARSDNVPRRRLSILVATPSRRATNHVNIGCFVIDLDRRIVSMAVPGQVTDVALQEGEQLVGSGPVAAQAQPHPGQANLRFRRNKASRVLSIKNRGHLVIALACSARLTRLRLSVGKLKCRGFCDGATRSIDRLASM